MKSVKHWIGAAVCIGAVLGGCDPAGSSSDRLRSRVEIDLAPLHRVAPAGSQEGCMWVARELVVTAGGREQCREPVTPEDVTVRCPVEVEVGSVTFEAEIRNGGNEALFAASTTTEVTADSFQVDLDLRARRPVMQVCTPRLGIFEITNRGNDSLRWSVTPQDNCPLDFEPDQGDLAAGASEFMEFFGSNQGLDFCVEQIESAEGNIKICACPLCRTLEEANDLCCEQDDVFCTP